MDIWKDGFGLEKGGLLDCLREKKKKKKKGEWWSWAIEVFVLDFLHLKNDQLKA